MDPLKMYFLLKNGDIPASYVSLPEGTPEKAHGFTLRKTMQPPNTKFSTH